MTFDEFAENLLDTYDTDAELGNEDPNDDFVNCPECGEPIYREDGCCPACGYELNPNDDLVNCPNCGESIYREDECCPACGYKLDLY